MGARRYGGTESVVFEGTRSKLLGTYVHTVDAHTQVLHIACRVVRVARPYHNLARIQATGDPFGGGAVVLVAQRFTARGPNFATDGSERTVAHRFRFEECGVGSHGGLAKEQSCDQRGRY